MQKKLFVGVMLIVLSATPAWALEATQQTWFNNLTDSMATIGQDRQSKNEIIGLRKNSRREYRQQKDQIRKRKATRKKISQQQKAFKRRNNSGHTRIGT